MILFCFDDLKSYALMRGCKITCLTWTQQVPDRSLDKDY